MTLAVAALLLFAPETISQKAELLSDQALARAQAGQIFEAQALWREALAISDGLFSANFNLGYSFVSEGKPLEAEPYLRAACKAKPDDFNAHYLLGSALLAVDKRDNALSVWRKALAIRPDHPKLMQIMIVEYGKGSYFGEASRLAQVALTANKADAQLISLAIKAYQDNDQHDLALPLSLSFVEEFPTSARANFEAAYELHRAGRPAESVPFLEKAIQLDPAHEEPYFLRGEILLRQGNPQAASALFRQAIERKPNYLAASISLARALADLGSLDLAIAQLQSAVRQNPDHPQPHLLLSQLYFRQGNENAAVQAKQRSLELRRQQPQALEGAQSRNFKDK